MFRQTFFLAAAALSIPGAAHARPDAVAASPAAKASTTSADDPARLPPPKVTGNDPQLAQRLYAKDQALLIAVHNGGRALWASTTTPDFFYMEEGGMLPRETLLAELVPDNARGLIIRDFDVHRFGDTALVLHHDMVRPTADDPRATQPQMYVMTETWIRDGDDWKLHVVHIDAVKTPPPEVSLTTAQLDDLAGTYSRGTSVFQVRRVGDHLVANRPGDPEVVLHAETRDVLFDPAELRARYIFERDSRGNVTALVRRYENSDDVWTRQA